MWLPVNLQPAGGDEGRAMMHDGFYDSYQQYAKQRDREGM
jgi:hypothetical protein